MIKYKSQLIKSMFQFAKKKNQCFNKYNLRIRHFNFLSKIKIRLEKTKKYKNRGHKSWDLLFVELVIRGRE